MLRVVVVVSVVVASSIARADEPNVCKVSSDCRPSQSCTVDGRCVEATASDDDVAKAKVHFDQGVVLFNDGNYAAAIAEFQASHKLNPLPFVFKNIGLAHQRLFQYTEALVSLQRYVDQMPDAADVAEVKQIIAEIRALLVELRLTITPVSGVTIKIDGRPAGTTPLAEPILIATGNHAIELAADGYVPHKRDLIVSSRAPLDLKVDLVLIPKSGKVRISSSVPRATVSIDGKPVGIVPLEVELAGGGHTLEVIAPDHQPHRGELVVTVGTTRDVDITLDRVVVVPRGRPWYKKWYVVAPIGAVVVGAGVGGMMLAGGVDPIGGTLAPGAGKVR